MTGKEIFDRYQRAALAKGLGSKEFHYGNVLYQALRIEGEERVFQLLEVAESTGQKIGLAYSVNASEHLVEPDIAVLI